MRNTSAHAPNISLNSHNQFGRTEVRAVAVIGTILQLGVLILSIFATFYPTDKFLKDGKHIAPYALICFATGTVLLVFGMLLCAHVVETSTEERVYRPGLGKKARLVWLQKTKAVSDQVFDSFALFPMDERSLITTSHRANKLIEGHGLAMQTVVGTMVSVCGFILQFVGFRGMHWIVTLTQLGAVLFMAGLRAWVRRGLAKPLQCKRLAPGFELEWFTSMLGNVDSAWLDASQDKTTCSEDWRVMTGGSPTSGKLRGDLDTGHQPELTNMNEESKAHNVMMMRRDLGQLADWRGLASAEAIALARALEITMDALFVDSPARKFTWSLKAYRGEIDFRLERQQNGNWKAYSDEIEAALSLWLYSVDEHEHRDDEHQLEMEAVLKRARKDDAWLRAKGSPAKPSLRLLGPYTPSLHRDLRWWMPRDTSSRIVEVEETDDGTLRVENHRIVGSGFDPSEDVDDSATLKEHKTGGSVSDPSPAYQKLDQQTRQYNRRELTNLSFDLTDVGEGRTGSTLLAIESYSSLELLYAQDMFSTFMRAAAKTLGDPFAGDADLRPDDTSSIDAWQFFTLRNSRLSKLAQDVQSTGLGSLEEIHLSIIPPLSAENKLPRADDIIELARRQAKRHEQVGHWKEAGDAYLWLFRTAKTFPEDSGIFVRATAVLLEFLRCLALTIKLGEAHHEVQELRLLEELKSTLKNELKLPQGKDLKDEVQERFPDLMKLYEKQDRGWTGDLNQDVGPYLKKTTALPGGFNFTELHHLAQFGDHIAEMSIKTGVEDGQNVNARDIHHWTPLHYAATAGCLRSVNQLLYHRADVNSCDLIEWTPLHYACQRGHATIIRNLLQGGADINFQGRDRVAPLHCAAMNGHQDVVRILIEAGATIDILDASGNTPLFWAVYKGQKNMVEDLWTDANKKLRDYNGRTTMHLAAAVGGAEMVQLLFDKLGADKEARDRNGQTPLHRAAECGHDAVVRLLIDKPIGANKEPKDIRGSLPLHLAALGGHLDVMRLLVNQFDADKEAKDDSGWTPLHWAVVRGQEVVVRWLVTELDADKEAKDKRDQTPLHSAVDNRQEGIARLLVKELNANTEAKNFNGFTPLHLAAERGYEDMVRFFVTELDADKEAKDEIGRTPMHWAAERGRGSVVRLLAEELNANTEAIDNEGNKPLHWATMQGHGAIVEFLSDFGANK